MQKDNTLLYWVKIVSLGLILGLGLQLAEAWTAPSALPPGGNVSGPVTVGDVGQSKAGNLALNTSGIYANGLLVPNGNVGIGTVAPNKKLHIVFNNPNTDGTNGQLVVENTANSANGVAAMNIRVGNAGAMGNLQFSVGNWQGSANKAAFGYDHGGQEFEFWTLNGTWSPKLFIGQTGNLAANGNIASGTSVTAPQFCIGASCINSWPSGGSDNLGNHTATQNLAMGGFNISNAGSVYANTFYDNNNVGYYLDPASTSFVNGIAAVGNYTTVNGNITTTNGDVSGKRVCINGVCQGSWPAGGSGTVTSLSAGNGITLSPNPIVGAGTISWNHTATQNLNMNTTNRIINLAAPTDNNDAATKGYVDSKAPNGKACPNGQFVTGIQVNGNLICAPTPSGSGNIVAGCGAPSGFPGFVLGGSGYYSCYGGASISYSCGSAEASSCSLASTSCPPSTTKQMTGTYSFCTIGGDGSCGTGHSFICIQN
ncbi:MAG: hypothetical protein KBD19_03230 [Candidatus Moranbacteria bacterium]|nr:hypothetical protein [Candidatus Moranbacteria bacterium]